MIRARVPEVVIKFTQAPPLPAQGKKAPITVVCENDVKVMAELTRKSAAKQLNKIDNFDDWLGILKGEIAIVDADNCLHLENARIEVVEQILARTLSTCGELCAFVAQQD